MATRYSLKAVVCWLNLNYKRPLPRLRHAAVNHVAKEMKYLVNTPLFEDVLANTEITKDLFKTMAKGHRGKGARGKGIHCSKKYVK